MPSQFRRHFACLPGSIRILEHHPFLIGRRRVFERAEGQRLECPRPPGIGTPAGFVLGVQVDRSIEGNTVPVLDRHALNEVRIA